MSNKTIIVGGGIAGMSCADALLTAGQAFLLITPSLGGRIMYSEPAEVNYGAYFVMGNYTHTRRLLARGKRIDPLKACFHKSPTERYTVLSWHTLRLFPEFIRLFLAMMEFSSHYEAFKRRCLVMPLRQALEADSYMQEIYTKPAPQFVRQKRYERAAADYVAMFSYGCTGASVDALTSLDFLNVSMGLIVAIHNLIFDRHSITQRLGNCLVTDSVVSIEKQDGLYILKCSSGHLYQAENVILATPASVTQELLGLKQIRAAASIYVHHIRGELKPVYRKYEINLFPYTSEIMLTARQSDGTFLVYSRVKDADLAALCDRFELLAKVDWEEAMFVHGDTYMEQQAGEGLYIAGDHNGLGLEPAAISGLYAAGQIIHKSTGSQPA